MALVVNGKQSGDSLISFAGKWKYLGSRKQAAMSNVNQVNSNAAYARSSSLQSEGWSLQWG